MLPDGFVTARGLWQRMAAVPKAREAAVGWGHLATHPTHRRAEGVWPLGPPRRQARVDGPRLRAALAGLVRGDEPHEPPPQP
eukprot:7578660-Pyramimonas_sp.AAC.1